MTTGERERRPTNEACQWSKAGTDQPPLISLETRA